MKRLWLLLTALAAWGLGTSWARAQAEADAVYPGTPWRVGAEYILWWIPPPSTSVPVLTTGSSTATVPGALGQPGTSILSNNSTVPISASGVRVLAQYSLDANELYTIDANYMILFDQRSGSIDLVSSGAADSPVLTRPFFNPVANREDADPRALPGILSGSVSQAFQTQMQGAECNFRACSLGADKKGFGVEALVGGRWLQLQERFTMDDRSQDLPTGAAFTRVDGLDTAFANTFQISDTFTTANNLLGGQVGAGVVWRYDDIRVEVLGKFAGGANLQRATIDGSTTVTNQVTGQSVTDRQGLYAQRSNIGSYTQTSFAWIPELDVNFSFYLTSAIRAKVGYSLLAFINVVRPSDVIDRTVNVQPLLAPTQLGVARPAFQGMTESSILLQGLCVGLEFMF